jgi:hypothetical protein
MFALTGPLSGCGWDARRALGCILVEMLTGTKAFDGPTLPAVIMKIIQVPTPDLPFGPNWSPTVVQASLGPIAPSAIPPALTLPPRGERLLTAEHQRVCTQGAHNPLPAGTPEDVVQLVAECLAKDPAQRPSATVLLTRPTVVAAAPLLDARLRDAAAARDEDSDDDDEAEGEGEGEVVREEAEHTLRTAEPAWGDSGSGCFMWVRGLSLSRPAYTPLRLGSGLRWEGYVACALTGYIST